jgi:hypothetical protein
MKRRIDPALEHRSKRPAQVSDQIRQMETLADSYYSLPHFFSAPHEYSVLCDQVIECELTQLSAVLIMAAVGLRLRYSNCALGLPPRGSGQAPLRGGTRSHGTLAHVNVIHSQHARG